MEVYLELQKVAADNLQEQLESNPEYQAEIGELRSRICDGGPRLKKMVRQPRRHRPHFHASVAHR